MESTDRLFNSWGITYRQINDQYFSSADRHTSTHIETHEGSFSEIIAWLPEIQSLWGHHKCIAGYHYLKGCAEKKPKEESPLDCNATPECHKTALDGRTLKHFIQLYFVNLVRLWCNFLLKLLEYFVVFSFMHCHLLQVCLCQGCGKGVI